MPLGGAAPQIVPLLPKSGYESCDKIEFASARFTLPNQGKRRCLPMTNILILPAHLGVEGTNKVY